MARSETQTIDDLYAQLRDATTGETPYQRLTLSKALLPAAGELVANLLLQSLTIEQNPHDKRDMVQRDGDRVKVTGTAKLFPSGPAQSVYSVTLIGTMREDPPTPALAMEAFPIDGSAWTFAGNFAATFPSYLGVDQSTLAWLPSFLPEAVFMNPVFSLATDAAPPPAGLHFKGELDVTTGSLASLKAFFTNPLLPVAGPVTLRPNTYPLLDWVADPEYSIPQLADVQLEISVADETTMRYEPGVSERVPAQSNIELVARSFADFRVTSPLLQSPYAWILTARTTDPKKYSLSSGLLELAEFAGVQALPLPTGFNGVTAMYLESITVGFPPSKMPIPDVVGFRIAANPDKPVIWNAPILGVSLRDLVVAWDVVSAASDPTLFGTMTGTLLVGQAKLNAELMFSDLNVAYAPNVIFSMSLDPTTTIPIDSLFTTFTGLDLGIPLEIVDLRLEGSTGERSLQFVAGLKPGWPKLGFLTSIDEVTLAFLYAPNSFTATVGVNVTLVGLKFMLGAAFRGEREGWQLSGGLLPDSQGTSLGKVLSDLAPGYFPNELPANLGAVTLQDVSASFNTGQNNFSFHGAVSWPFRFQGLDVNLEAELSVDKDFDDPGQLQVASTVLRGFVRGALMIGALAVGVTYTFGVEGNRTISFVLAWRERTVTCLYSKNLLGQAILRANLGGVSFGDIVEWLAGLGGKEVHLSAPWDVLYRLRFDDLWLEVNLETKELGVSYGVGVDLGIARVDAIGLTYTRRAGSPSLDIRVTGSFVGVQYPSDDPLTWDLINDPPPTPPGKGEALLDLRYLGLGQNVGFRDARSLDSVVEVIEALRADFRPTDSDADPLASLTALTFTGDGNWLIGADFTVMSAVSVAGVFADPSLYGIRIGLAGERMKSLSGLEFEILYRKITETIGVYHLELTLPEAMRQIMLGPVAVTVPTVTVDLYTNGNFRLDFGFPAGGNWERSFCLQAGPFIGYGGFYFALLDGSTSDKLPAISNGSFAPVIEFGVGLQVGVGRTINKGILKAAATITVQGIVEGVLAWFNPAEHPGPAEMYFWIQGTVAVVGTVYGVVDFVAVKANISIVASAAVTMTIEAYQPITVELVLAVEISASITILFVSVLLSFSARLDLSFTIGSASAPPWQVAAPDPLPSPALISQRSSHRLRRRTASELLQAADRRGPDVPMDWAVRAVFGDGGPADVDLLLVPVLTPALDAALRPATQVVMSLIVPTSTPPEARHADEVRRMVRDDAQEVSFNRIATGLLRWAIGAVSLDRESVTIVELEAIAAGLADRTRREALFTYDTVTAFIEQNFRLRISNPVGPTGGSYDVGSDLPRDTDAPPVQGAAFPMIPEITMRPAGRDEIRFWEHSEANADYRAFLDRYYQQLQSTGDGVGPRERSTDEPAPAGPVGLVSGAVPPAGAPRPHDHATDLQPVGEMVFCDWFALVTQQVVDEAADMLRAYPYRPTGTETLREIVDSFDRVALAYLTRVGDTPATIAAAFGTSPSALRDANAWLSDTASDVAVPAGSTVRVDVGATVGTVATANPAYPLRPNGRLTIAGVRYQVRRDDTLQTIAAAFDLADLGALLVGPGTDVNARNPALLTASATLEIPASTRVVTADDLRADDPLKRIVAMYYTRARQRPLDQVTAHIAWYTAAIGVLNPTFRGTVKIPVAHLVGDRIVDTGTSTDFALHAGDTLADVAATFALLHLAPEDSDFLAFYSAVTTEPEGPLRVGTDVRMPPCRLTVRLGDSFGSLAEALLVSTAGDVDEVLVALAALARANSRSWILAPLAVLALPPITLSVGAGDTLGTVAQRFSLSLEELAVGLQDDRGVFAPYDGRTSLTIPDVPTRRVGLLIDDLLADGAVNSVSTTASRFALAGMRAPLPGPTGAPSGEFRGLYDVIGQQFPAPAATGATYTVGFENARGTPWFCFEPAPGGREAGECSSSLEVALTPAYFADNAPSPVLTPLTVTGPVSMPLSELVTSSHALEHRQPWQVPTTVTLPGPTGPTGALRASVPNPSVWMFPVSLLRQLGPSGPTGPTATTPPYDLLATPIGAARGATGRPLERYGWATAIPLTVTRALDNSGGAIRGTYEIAAVAPSARRQLLEAWQTLRAAPSDRDRLYLLRAPAPVTGNDAGWVSDALSTTRTFLLRTNLSTETHSGARLSAHGTESGDYFSRITAPGPFLQHVWEAAVTASGGFHLAYETTDGSGLPDELFADDGTARLVILLLLDRQTRPDSPERGLLRFNNCAVIGDGLDASAIDLSAGPRAPAPSERQRVATLAPGVVGFGLARRNPQMTTGGDPDHRTRELHSLVGYRVVGDGDFHESNDSLPVGPADERPSWLRLPPGPTHAYWSYAQSVPVARFGRHNACPDSPALPRPAANPYAGITGPTGPSDRDLSRARLEFIYHDVYGNTTGASPPAGDLEVPVGYTDDVVPVTAWPAAGFDYLFEPLDSGGICLVTTLTLQLARYLPGDGGSYERAVEAATADAARYAALFYQLQQCDVTFAMGSNLGRPDAPSEELRPAITAFVTKAKVLTDTAATLRQVTYLTRANESLSTLANRLAITPRALLEANRDVDAAALFPDSYVRPHIVAAPAMNTLTSLINMVVGRCGVPESERTCPGANPPDPSCPRPGPALTRLPPGATTGPAAPTASEPAPEPAAIASDNDRQPLTPGIVLRTKARTSEPLPMGYRSLAAAAEWLRCAVFAVVTDPDHPGGLTLDVGLAVDNWAAAGVIADGVAITIDGFTMVTQQSTLDTVHQFFTAPDRRPELTRGDVVAAVSAVDGLLVEGCILTWATFVVPSPGPASGPAPAEPTFTLADMVPSAGTIAELASLNRRVPNFFATGTPLLLGYSCCSATTGNTPASLALEAGITVPQLAHFNAGTVLGAEVAIVVPDLTTFGPPDTCWATFSPDGTDSLATVASAVGAPPQTICDVNRHLPGIFRTGATLTVGGAQVIVDAEDSLHSAFVRSGAASWDLFVVALGQQVNAGVYRPAGAIITPLPVVPSASPAIEDLAAQLHVGATTLLTANQNHQGVLRLGAAIHGPRPSSDPADDETPLVVIGEFDTVLTVLRKLRQLGSPASIETVIEANRGRTGLLTPAAALLLPPTPTELTSPFSPQLPPVGNTGERTILFPIEVWLDVERSALLVHPEFRDSAPVQRARSELAPRTEGTTDGRLALRGFADAFERAFAAQPLKCAIAAGSDAGASPPWAVNFGAQGISHLAVDAARPAFYAPRPLSTTPWSGELRYPTYVSGQGLCAEVTRRVQNVDPDAWLRDLLGTIDLALTPGYAVRAFQMDGAADPHSGSTDAGIRHPVDALAVPTPPPAVTDPLSGPMGLSSAAQRSRPHLGRLAVGASGCTGPTASGPTDYERLVGAKADMARSLSARIGPIVDALGATGPFQLAWATEALHQQLLVQLSENYKLSAIVQLPCEVHSPLVTPAPGTTGPPPPRASGKVTSVFPVVPQIGTTGALPFTPLAAVAAALDISAPFLAQIVADVPGLLRPGIVIDRETVRDDDTINTVAGRSHVPTNPAEADYWRLWSEFIDGFAEQQDVLQPGARLPISSLTRTITDDDTLTTIGEFFARDATTVGRANQLRAGVVRPGPVSVDGYPTPYQVTAGDTLTSIASGIGAANPTEPELTVDTLLSFVRNRKDFLAESKTCRMIELVPGLSVTTSKVSLGPVSQPHGPPPPLTFLLTVPQVADHASLLLNLKYVINEIEYDIQTVAGAGGYQSSSWLTFVLPLDGSQGGVDAGAATLIPQLQVPIPLRAYPTASVLAAQNGLATNRGSELPAQARKWDYSFDVATRRAAQDTNHLQVRFGEEGVAQTWDSVSQNLMTWLGAYTEAATALKNDLSRLATSGPPADDPVAAHAMQALSLIAEGVSQALGAGEPFMAVGATAQETFAYQMTTLTDGHLLSSLTLTPEEPGPTGPSSIWPLVSVKIQPAPTGGGEPRFVTMTGSTGTYGFPVGLTATDEQTYRFHFDGRDVIRNRTGRGAISTSRNDRLIARGPLGPTGSPAPVPTNESFVYRTPFVQFVDPLVPLIDADGTVDVAALDPGARRKPLIEHLINALRATTDLDPDGAAEPVDIELSTAYGFRVTPELLVRTPILLVPWRHLKQDNVSGFVNQLAASLMRWHGDTTLDPDGQLIFGLTVFAAGGLADGGARRPIIHFADLRLNLNDIIWSTSQEPQQ